MKLKKTINGIGLCILIIICISLGCSQKDNKTHIRFSTWGSETEINILKPIITEFESDHPNIDVEIIHIPQNYFQKLQMLVAANLTPDVIFINNLNLPLYAPGNTFMDLNPYLKKSSVLSKDGFFPESLITMSIENKLLAIPRDISNVVIYYNKDLFDKYNVSYPSENWSTKEFLSDAQKLTIDTHKDGKIDIFGISFDDNVLFYLPFVWSNGGNIFDETKKNMALDKKASCEGLQFYADLRNKYHVAPRAAESGNNTMAQLFMQQRLAMFISGRWSVPRFRKDLNFNWDITSFPKGKAGSIVGIDGSGWAISSKTMYPEESWQLIEYLASFKSISKFTETGLIVPSRKDVAFSKSFLNTDLAPSHAKTFLTIINNAKPTPQIERWNEVIDQIDLAMEPVWNGTDRACTTLRSIKSNVKELLE